MSQRLSALLLDGPATVWDLAVPACPGWDVKAVISHVVGNVDVAPGPVIDDLFVFGPRSTPLVE